MWFSMFGQTRDFPAYKSYLIIVWENQYQRTVKSFSWEIAALNRNLPSLFLTSYICQSLLSNLFEEGVAASADLGLEFLYKYKFVRIYYINILSLY